MARRKRPHPASRSRRFVGWASVGIATTLGAGMTVNAALAPASAGANAKPNATSGQRASDSAPSGSRAATPSTTVPRKSAPVPKARSKAS